MSTNSNNNADKNTAAVTIAADAFGTPYPDSFAPEHLDALAAVAAHHGWRMWEVRVLPNYGLVEAKAISPSGRHRLMGVFNSSGAPEQYYVSHEPNGDFDGPLFASARRRLSTVARRSSLEDIAVVLDELGPGV